MFFVVSVAVSDVIQDFVLSQYLFHQCSQVQVCDVCNGEGFSLSSILQTGQVGLGVGTWTSNLTNTGLIPGEFD